MEKVFEIYIRTTPERLWEAITDSETRSKYQFGCLITSDWAPRVETSFHVPKRRKVGWLLRLPLGDKLS